MRNYPSGPGLAAAAAFAALLVSPGEASAQDTMPMQQITAKQVLELCPPRQEKSSFTFNRVDDIAASINDRLLALASVDSTERVNANKQEAQRRLDNAKDLLDAAKRLHTELNGLGKTSTNDTTALRKALLRFTGMIYTIKSAEKALGQLVDGNLIIFEVELSDDEIRSRAMARQLADLEQANGLKCRDNAVDSILQKPERDPVPRASGWMRPIYGSEPRKKLFEDLALLPNIDPFDLSKFSQDKILPLFLDAREILLEHLDAISVQGDNVLRMYRNYIRQEAQPKVPK